MVYTHTIVGDLPSQAVVKMVISNLKKAGFDINKLSVIGKDGQTDLSGREFSPWQPAPGLGDGLFSILAGAGMLFIRGVGLVVIAGPVAGLISGWLRRTVAGEAGLTAIGGIVGALSVLGVSPEQALQSEAQIKAGKFLMLVAGSDRDISQVHEVLSVMSAQDTLPTAV
jgi:hypothetical protein